MLEAYLSKRNLIETWKEIYSSKPIRKRRFSRGVDGISIEDFKSKEEKYLDEINRQLKGGFFGFDQLFHYQINKKGKKPRDIQAPTIKDRIVQRIIVKYLSKKFLKKKFSNVGIVGSVEDTTLKKTIKLILDYTNEGYVYILKTDIRDYFPSINKSKLQNIIQKHVSEDYARKMLYKYLNQSNRRGIPQGPPLSPLMANLFLYAVDNYLSKRKKIRHVRYVDDILVFTKSKKDAKRIHLYIEKHLSEEYGLTIHPLGSKKTKIGVYSDGQIDTLGVIYKNGEIFIKKEKILDFLQKNVDTLGRGKTRLVLKMSGKTIPEKLDDLINRLNRKIIGWGNAYNFCNTKNLFDSIDKKIENRIIAILDELEHTKGIKYSEIKRKKIIGKLKKLTNTPLKPIILS